MSDGDPVPIRPGQPEGFAAPKPATTHNELDVAKVAVLVADGEIEWPTDLTDAQAAALSKVVREINRSRLINLVARLIAEDIFRDHAQEFGS